MKSRSRPSGTFLAALEQKAERWWPESRGRYKTETKEISSVSAHRRVIRHKVRFSARGRRREILIFENVGSATAIRSMYGLMRSLARRRPARGLVPTPLWLSSDGRRLAYVAVPGQSVRDLLEKRRISSARTAACIRASAAWLRTFHALPVSLGAGAEPVRIEPLIVAVPRTIFDNWASLVRLAARANIGLIHGDPHLANLIVQGSKVGLIDYSECRRASRWRDVAMYKVHLDVALQPFFSRRVIEKMTRGFERAYVGRALRPDERRILNVWIIWVANHFLRFTQHHHPRPRSYVAWIIRRFRLIAATAGKEIVDYVGT